MKDTINPAELENLDPDVVELHSHVELEGVLLPPAEEDKRTRPIIGGHIYLEAPIAAYTFAYEDLESLQNNVLEQIHVPPLGPSQSQTPAAAAAQNLADAAIDANNAASVPARPRHQAVPHASANARKSDPHILSQPDARKDAAKPAPIPDSSLLPAETNSFQNFISPANIAQDARLDEQQFAQQSLPREPTLPNFNTAPAALDEKAATQELDDWLLDYDISDIHLSAADTAALNAAIDALPSSQAFYSALDAQPSMPPPPRPTSSFPTPFAPAPAPPLYSPTPRRVGTAAFERILSYDGGVCDGPVSSGSEGLKRRAPVTFELEALGERGRKRRRGVEPGRGEERGEGRRKEREM
ncbi:hypothetical protein ACLMJK_000558 [Lecanora helva]